MIEFGPLNSWTNSYWGGALAAAAGCLVFGALPRLRAGGRPRDAVLLGAGLGLHLLIRQFESVLLFLAVILFFLPAMRRAGGMRPSARLAGVVALALLPAVLLTLLQNRMVTGSWTTVPERLSQVSIWRAGRAHLSGRSGPAPATYAANRRWITRCSFRSTRAPKRSATYFQRLEYRVRFYRFFFLPPLYLAAAAFFASLREYRFVWVVLTLAIFALGTNFFPAFQFHYIAAVTCLFILVAVTGLQQIARISIRGHPAGLGSGRADCPALLRRSSYSGTDCTLPTTTEFSMAARQYEVWDAINHQNPARRIMVARELAQIPGKLLVFVRYSPHHIFQDEWVYNRPLIDAARWFGLATWARRKTKSSCATIPGAPRCCSSRTSGRPV